MATENKTDYEKLIGKAVIGGLKGAALGTLVTAFSIPAMGHIFSWSPEQMIGATIAGIVAPTVSVAIQAATSHDGNTSPDPR